MAYIGKQPVVGNFQVCDAISVVNGQAAYTMQVGSANVEPENANHMLVSLNGVLQKPGSSFTISGATITFASNLATNDVIDFIILLGDTLNIGTPSDDTVGAAQVAPTIITGQTAETSIATDDTILIHDTSASALRKMTRANFVSGVSGVAGSPIMIMIGNGSNQTISTGTFTKVTCLTAELNSDSMYDTSANQVTIPSGKGGKYLISFTSNFSTSTDFNEAVIRIRKNGSDFLYSSTQNKTSDTMQLHSVRSLSASDVLEVNVYHDRGSDAALNAQAYRTLYSIVRLAE